MKARSLFSIGLSNGNSINVNAYSKRQAKFLAKSLYGLSVDISMITKDSKLVQIPKWKYCLLLIDAYKHEADICSGLVDP